MAVVAVVNNKPRRINTYIKYDGALFIKHYILNLIILQFTLDGNFFARNMVVDQQ